MAFNKLFVKLPEKTFIKLKELKIKTHLNWSQLFIYLCDTIPRPESILENYKLDEKKTKNFSIKISTDSWVKFSTFSVVFLKHAHAIDYLVNEEKNKVGFLPPV